MTSPLAAITPVGSLKTLDQVSSISSVSQNSSKVSFGEMLNHALDNLNNISQESDALAEAFAAGGDVEIHEVMIAMQETQMAFEMVTQVRNKMVEAYQEIMRMQI